MTAENDKEKNPRNAEVELTEEQKKADKDGNNAESEISTGQEKPQSDIDEHGDKFDQAANPKN